MQSTTGFSPLRLLIGVEGDIPSVRARLDEIGRDNLLGLNTNINVHNDRAIAKQCLAEVARKFKKRFDATRRNNVSFVVGDIVFVNQDHRRNNKLEDKFKGPYEIISSLPNDRFALKGRGNLRNLVIAKDKLRLWPGELEENVI